MNNIRITPSNDKTNGWSQLLPVRQPKKPLNSDIDTDWLVIGSGLSGLAASRRLAENRPDDKVVLIEADVVGEGAHGRNSGFAIDVPHNVGNSLDDLKFAKSHLRLARTSIEYLKEQVDRYNIDCDWRKNGKFHAAVSKRGIEKILKPTRQMLEAIKEPYTWLEGDSLYERLGFKHFKTAIYTPGTILLNPAALCRGLADNMPENVFLFENTPALKILELSDQIKVETPNGSINTKKVILTVNAFIDQFGFYKNQYVPLAAHASLTRVMTPSEQKALGGDITWGLTPANAFVGITMRRTPDQRILIRQQMDYQPNLSIDKNRLNQVRNKHKKLFDERFPMLPNLAMEYTWTGFIAVTKNGSPCFGKISDRIYSAAVHNGVGLTKGTMTGILIADQACEVKNPLLQDQLALGLPPKLPPRPFLDVGISLRLAWERWHDHKEA